MAARHGLARIAPATGGQMEDGILNGLRVMVIDDSKTIRRTAETLLKKEGCEVVTATARGERDRRRENRGRARATRIKTQLCTHLIIPV